MPVHSLFATNDLWVSSISFFGDLLFKRSILLCYLYRSYLSSLFPLFGVCMLRVVFKVWEVCRFVLFQNYSLSFSSQFLTEYWHWTVMQLLAHFSIVIVSSKPTILHAMLNSSPPCPLPLPCASLCIYLQGILICDCIALSLSLVNCFWNSTLSVLVLTIPNNSDQEDFSPTLIPFPRTLNSTGPRKGLCKSAAAMSVDCRNWIFTPNSILLGL